MSSGIFSIGLSGLQAAQAGLRVASQNISNANTPGYVRNELDLSPRTVAGGGGGVQIDGVRRAADQFLTQAFFTAEGSRAAASARADLLNRAQATFGDPAGDTSFFSALDTVWTQFTQVGVDPASTLRRDEALSALQSLFGEVNRVSQDVQDLITEADSRVADTVDTIQGLINSISSLNGEIALAQRSGGDATGGQSVQAALLDQLSSLVDIQTTQTATGGVQVRTAGGALLVGTGVAQLTYSAKPSQFGYPSAITITGYDGSSSTLDPFVRSGELNGLLQARDVDLQNIAESLGAFAGALADAVNEIHNENAAAPAPSTLNGRNTGFVAADTLNFSGRSIIGVVDGDGALVARLTVDFDNGQITSDAPTATYAFADRVGFVSGAPGQSLTEALNAALSASAGGSASFTNGRLSLSAPGGGLIVQQDPAAASARAGRGFAHTFGLNDLVYSATPPTFETGLHSTDAHGFATGGEIRFRVTDAAGRIVAEPSVTISGALAASGATFGDLETALNAGTGIGTYGSASFDNTLGTFTITGGGGYKISVVDDSTIRGDTATSFSGLFGASRSATAGRAVSLAVHPDVAADSMRLAVARPDLTLPLGDVVVEKGDNRGAIALAGLRDLQRDLPSAGSLRAQTGTLALFASRIGGEAGRQAAQAERLATSSEALAGSAAERRASVEGVNIDDELVRLTIYQQSYAASARVIQAATEMMDLLVSLGAR